MGLFVCGKYIQMPDKRPNTGPFLPICRQISWTANGGNYGEIGTALITQQK